MLDSDKILFKRVSLIKSGGISRSQFSRLSAALASSNGWNSPHHLASRLTGKKFSEYQKFVFIAYIIVSASTSDRSVKIESRICLADMDKFVV